MPFWRPPHTRATLTRARPRWPPFPLHDSGMVHVPSHIVWPDRPPAVQVAQMAGWRFLHAWGRVDDGPWFACIGWEHYIPCGPRLDFVVFSAWLPAAGLTPDEDRDYSHVPRVQLGADAATWPVPPCPTWRRRTWHYGLIAAGDDLPVPPFARKS